MNQRLFGAAEITPSALLSVILVLLLCALVLLSFIPKARLAMWGGWYFIASADKKTNKPNDHQVNYSDKSCKRMKVVFIRHGESEWNYIFNKGSFLEFPGRLVRALINEGLMLFQQDSVFFDSPLSSAGITQAWDLLTFLASQKNGCENQGSHMLPVAELSTPDIVSIIRGDVGISVVASSILRRAISTGIIGLSARLLKTQPKDKLVLMTALQEISRNVDTLSLIPARSKPRTPVAEANLQNIGDFMSHFYRSRLDQAWNFGNKDRKMKARGRQDEFNKWLFQQSVDCVIVCGHSLWFKEFFKSFLPKACDHPAKKYKIVNCGVVAFDIYKTDSLTYGNVLRINPDSIKEVYGGFEIKGKKNKKS